MVETAVTFGPFSLDPSAGLLARDGKPLPLGGRAMALLVALAKADEAVSKQALMEAGWPGTVVEEGNLTVQIAALRKALGEREDGGEWIVTVPRVGYRLVRRAPSVDTEVAVRPSLAVMPFANLSADPEQDYFADGIVEDIITALSRFRSFAVVARNSSFAYKGRAVDVRTVASELGVRYVLEGSVRKAGGRLRITTQLIEAESGTHLSAETFEGKPEDVFDFQDRITESVAIVVEPRIQRAEVLRSRRDRPGSLAAYDLYLQAVPKAMTGRLEGNSEALELFEKAVGLDPTYAIGAASIAWVLEHRIGMGWPSATTDDTGRCLEMASVAMALAPDDALVLAHCGRVMQVVAGDFEGGLLTVERAVRSNPNHAHVVLCAGSAHLQGGDLAEAERYFRRLADLDVVEAYVAYTGIAHVQMARGDYQSALESARRSLPLNPSYDPTYWMLVAGNAHLGRMEAARTALESYLAIVPEMTLARLMAGQRTKDPQRTEVVLTGLRLAGLPES